ncbi:MAG: corrinoid protein [Chloroflexi bacterium]|nr:corrinoid protein [Chloroflexota bacterium]
MTDELFKQMAQSIIDGDADAATQLAEQAIQGGLDPLEAITKGFVVGVNFVGQQFAEGEAFLPELVMAGEAMKAAVKTLEPEMMKRGAEREVLGKVVLATVEGDIHEIGKSLVGTMLTAAGFEVFDLGVDASPHKIIAKAIEVNADIIAMSALLTTTMVKQREVIDDLEKEGLRSRFKVMVGGAPITRDWVSRISADGYSEDAIGAVNIAKQLVAAG